jgi:ActR/RegA family two-component response regulator
VAASGLLIVDDDYRYLVGVRRALGASRPVFIARTAHEARQALTSEEIGVAVVDAQLDGESGIDLLFELHDQYPQLRAGLLSGFVTSQLCIAASSAGVRVIAAKPCSISDVVAAIESHTDRIPLTLIAQLPSLPGDRLLPLETLKRIYAQQGLARHNGNRTAAAHEMQISRGTLNELLRPDEDE